MRKLGLVLAALLVSACTHSVSGTGDNKGGTGGTGTDDLLGGSGNAAKNEANATTPASAESCSIETGSATCNACATKSCCTEIAACNGDQACSSLWSCLAQCGDDTTCGNACVDKYPTGKSGVATIVDCGKANCSTECE